MHYPTLFKINTAVEIKEKQKVDQVHPSNHGNYRITSLDEITQVYLNYSLQDTGEFKYDSQTCYSLEHRSIIDME